MDYASHPASGPLTGTIRVPGDKSLSHRAVLFSAMAEGLSQVSGLLDSADVRSTISAVRALGAEVQLRPVAGGLRHLDSPSLAGIITGWGSRGPRQPDSPIDCGNSGTTARLLLGVVGGWPVEVSLIGDESLSRRPMGRVASPLRDMGARFELSAEGTLPITSRGPLTDEGGEALLEPIEYDSPVASAQVKTAVLLAGLRAAGTTSVTEPAPSRDHTERLLPAYGIPVTVDDDRVSVTGPAIPQAAKIAVPGDPSSAAVRAAAAVLVPGSSVRLPHVALNPTRTGFVRVLRRMGAKIAVEDMSWAGREPVGTLIARWEPALHGCVVRPWEIASLVDEVPILALVATQARGYSRFERVGELRVKESDRLSAIVNGIRALGGIAWVDGDDLLVSGPAPLKGAALDSLGDHRLAMTWAVAGLASAHGVSVGTFEAVDVSFPRFAEALGSLRQPEEQAE